MTHWMVPVIAVGLLVAGVLTVLGSRATALARRPGPVEVTLRLRDSAVGYRGMAGSVLGWLAGFVMMLLALLGQEWPFLLGGVAGALVLTSAERRRAGPAARGGATPGGYPVRDVVPARSAVIGLAAAAVTLCGIVVRSVSGWQPIPGTLSIGATAVLGGLVTVALRQLCRRPALAGVPAWWDLELRRAAADRTARLVGVVGAGTCLGLTADASGAESYWAYSLPGLAVMLALVAGRRVRPPAPGATDPTVTA